MYVLTLNHYSRNLVLFNFRGDNARVFQRVSNESQYNGWSSRMPTILSTYSKHAGCWLSRNRRLSVTLSKELVAVHV